MPRKTERKPLQINACVTLGSYSLLELSRWLRDFMHASHFPPKRSYLFAHDLRGQKQRPKALGWRMTRERAVILCGRHLIFWALKQHIFVSSRVVRIRSYLSGRIIFESGRRKAKVPSQPARTISNHYMATSQTSGHVYECSFVGSRQFSYFPLCNCK